MVRVKMRDDDIRQVIEIHPGLFKTNDRVADTIHQNFALIAKNYQMSILVVFRRDSIG
jgi:hypothetical protein